MPDIISIATAQKLAQENIARLIDHTALRPDITAIQIEQLCREAMKYHFYSVCINSGFIPFVKNLLKTSDVKICSVIGFPLGATLSQVKVCEAEWAAKKGAEEIDIVINISALKDRNFRRAEEEIKQIVKVVPGLLCKVILENCLLTDQEKEIGCQIALQAGAHFVKTSTGFAAGGATVDDVKLMRRAVGEHLGVKAAGGIKDYKTALQMVQAGATRIGASKSIQIIEGSSFNRE